MKTATLANQEAPDLTGPLTSILASIARAWQILTTSWQPWIPWQDSY